MLQTLFGDVCARCGNTRTKDRVEGIATCEECAVKIRAEREESHPCPKCQQSMEKLIILNVIVDKCPGCHGVWLDPGELDLLKQAAEEEGGDGFFPGFILGSVVG